MMNNALKGALLSGLLFPGLGQVVLQRTKRGAAIIFVVGSSMFLAVVTGVKHTLAILEKVAENEGAISIGAILNAVTEAVITSRSPGFSIALLLTILGWVFGTLDAYRIGKIADATRRQPQQE